MILSILPPLNSNHYYFTSLKSNILRPRRTPAYSLLLRHHMVSKVGKVPILWIGNLMLFPGSISRFLQYTTINRKGGKKTASEIREYTVATEGGTFTLEKTASEKKSYRGMYFLSFCIKENTDRKKSCSSNNLNPGYFLWRRQRQRC